MSKSNETPHRVWLSKLACLAFRLNSELDKGSFISIEQACGVIKNERVVAFIKEKFGVEKRIGEIDFLSAEDDAAISSYFDRCTTNLCAEDLRVSRNGIAWLLALTIEMMQQEEWTTFFDPTAALE